MPIDKPAAANFQPAPATSPLTTPSLTTPSITTPPLTTEELKRIKHEISAKYGVDFDKELLPLICELLFTRSFVSEQTQKMQHNLQLATAVLEEKAGQPRSQIWFQTRGQAFCHGLGRFGAGFILLVCLCGIAGFIGYDNWREQTLALRRAAFLEKTRNIESFAAIAPLVQVQKASVASGTVCYIELSPVSGFDKARIGKDVVVDLQTRKLKLPLLYAPR